MPRTFAENKNAVLIEVYRAVRVSDGQIWFSASDLEPNCDHALSRSFIEIILKSLTKSALLEAEAHDGEAQYTLTEKGITSVEKLIEEQGLWREFENITTSVGEIIELEPETPELKEAREELAALSEALEKGNDLGDLTEEEAVAARAEVSALRTLLGGVRIRAGAAATQARQSLGWIMKKAGGTVVSELAKKALNSLLLLLGYGG